MTPSQLPLELPLLLGKPVRADWDGGDLSSDGGWLLLALADRQLRLTARLAGKIQDPRDPTKISHPLQRLLLQRILQIAQGYSDGNDAQTLRHDPLLKTATGVAPSGPALAGQSTLSRWENAVTEDELEQLEYLLQDLFVERCGSAPQRIVIDLDPYDDPCHGDQQGVLFNGYYDCHCYLPLLFCGTVDDGPQRLIGVVLREGNAGPTEEAPGFLSDLVQRIRESYPQVEIIVRGDSGYGVPVMIDKCRELDVRFCFGKARNAVLERLAVPTQERADRAEQLRAAQPTDRRRRTACQAFDSVSYRAQSWKQAERVLIKAERLYGKANPRFVVTDLKPEKGWKKAKGYRFYCQRGDRENRIKEFKLDMDGQRLSCRTMLANQFRLVLHSAAFLLYQFLQEQLRTLAPKHELARAQVSTLRVRLMKVAARIIERCRVVRVHLCTSFPLRALWEQLARQLLDPAPT